MSDTRFMGVFIDIVHAPPLSRSRQKTNLSSRLLVYSNRLIVHPASKMMNMHSISLTTLVSDIISFFIMYVMYVYVDIGCFCL